MIGYLRFSESSIQLQVRILEMIARKARQSAKSHALVITHANEQGAMNQFEFNKSVDIVFNPNKNQIKQNNKKKNNKK